MSMSVTFQPTNHFDATDLNVHNSGAAALLALLGYPVEDGDLGGVEEDAVLFTGRALLALALVDVASADNTGLPPLVEGNHINCGRPAGYLAERLEALVEVGMCAQELRTGVAWG
ncbi:hypothetical protein [Nocardiopsis synnemataformans]|uniref:hypothetical protein n=1 Tax=Nocardiopsis synnemataformans TaxID=61305 RepID=UPI003EBF7E4C